MTVRSHPLPEIALALIFGLTACGRGKGQGPEQVCLSTVTAHPQGTPAVATFDEGLVSRDELLKRLQQVAPVQQRGITLEQKKGIVRRLVQNQILAYEAVRAGLEKDPEITEAVRGALVQRLLHEQVEARVKPPTDAELKAFYDAHATDYLRQELIHVHDLFIAAPKSDPARVAQARKKAQALYAQLKAAPGTDFTLFGKLADQNNEDARSRASHGDLPTMGGKEFRAAYPPELVTALEGLKAPGDLSAPIQTDAGFYLLKLAQHTQAQAPALEQIKPQLKSRLMYERRTAAFASFLEEAERRHHFQVDDAALNAVQVPPTTETPHP